MSKLPTRIRVGIRDEWDNADSNLQKALSDFKEQIGFSIRPDCDWEKLWGLLEPYYKDTTTLVPRVAGLVTQWITILCSRLLDDENDAWASQFLDLLSDSPGSDFKTLKILTCPGSLPQMGYDKSTHAFSVFVPEAPMPGSGQIENAFLSGFQSFFETPSPGQHVKSSIMGGDERTLQASNMRKPARLDGLEDPEAMPVLETLSRPEYLFKDTLPYHMTVQCMGTDINVQGSHEPSLKLLAEYFQKWAKPMGNDTLKRPIINVELKESNFGMGTIFDGVKFELTEDRYSWVHRSPLQILAFIEGVLGYELTFEEAYTWHYKRWRAFKT